LWTLDEVAREAGWAGKRIDVLKIDCEGCEWSVFNETAAAAAAREVLTRVDQLLIELHFPQVCSATKASFERLVFL
jgi:FkbM family methyltransferase